MADQWDGEGFFQPMQPVERAAEGYTQYEVDYGGSQANPATWWLDEDDHAKSLPYGGYCFGENVFIVRVPLYPGTTVWEQDVRLRVELLGAGEAVLSSIEIAGHVGLDASVNPQIWHFSAPSVDLSNVKWVATFCGIRATLLAPATAPHAGITFLLTPGQKIVLLEGDHL